MKESVPESIKQGWQVGELAAGSAAMARQRKAQTLGGLQVRTPWPALWPHSLCRLNKTTFRQQQTLLRLLDWLRLEYGIEKPSNKHSQKLKADGRGRKARTRGVEKQGR